MKSKATRFVAWGVVLGGMAVSACSRQGSETLEAASAGPVFRAAASAGATAKVLTLTINKPTGTVAGDVMVASVAVRPMAVVITAPEGWTLVRRMDNPMTSLKTGANNANSLAVYLRVAGANESGSYSFTLDTSAGSVGGILSFSGVDTAKPIDVELGQNTPYNVAHDAPSVTTTVPNTMLVTSHSFRTTLPWTPPAGMTEAVDLGSDPAPGGVSLSINYGLQAGVGPTGVRTATAFGIEDDTGNAYTIALRPGSSTS